MLYEVLRTIRNFFPVENHYGTFKIEQGAIALDFLKDGQYYLIEGSVFNDGIHQHQEEVQLIDEEFDGTVTALAIPQAVLDLVSEIEDWQAQYGNASPFNSESFGGYSYTRTNGNGNGGASSWKEAFAQRLNAWRKL